MPRRYNGAAQKAAALFDWYALSLRRRLGHFSDIGALHADAHDDDLQPAH